ncbi:MAG: ribosome assembly factor SBDS, partial [archaeon]
MTQTEARVTKKGKKYEILVDLEEALKIREGKSSNLGSAVLTSAVFHNLKSGEQASMDELEIDFGTSNFDDVCLRILTHGEIVLPAEYLKKMQEGKYKQVVDFLSKNAISPQGLPYTPDRIMSALKEANVHVKNEAMDKQIAGIIEQIQRILPMKIEVKKVRVIIPAQYTGKAYGVVSDFKQEEEWMSNGDLKIIVGIPAGLIMDFFDKLNGVTHGAALT